MREAELEVFYYTDKVGLATVDVEVLSHAHQYLMAAPNFWNSLDLLEASKILCVTASDIRTARRTLCEANNWLYSHQILGMSVEKKKKEKK